MRAAAILIVLAAGISSASAASPDVAGALEARYGPFPDNAAVSVDVRSRQPFADPHRFREDGLPQGFLAVVWDRSNDRFAALVKTEDGKAVRIAGVASLEATVPVLLRRVAAGETLSLADVEMKPLKLASANGYATVATEVLGKQATKPIGPGRPIPLNALAVPPAVTRNADVTVVFRKGPLELSAKGKSLSDAALGETVRVSRAAASKVLEGVAVADGVVLVTEGSRP